MAKWVAMGILMAIVANITTNPDGNCVNNAPIIPEIIMNINVNMGLRRMAMTTFVKKQNLC